MLPSEEGGAMRPSPPPQIFLLRPGVLSYDKWVEKTSPYLYGMLDYMDRVISHNTSAPTASAVVVDRAGFHDALLKYVYRHSINRFKSYQIID